MEDRIFEDSKQKEFNCRQCSGFFNSIDLKKGCCPNCNTDEDLFLNIDED